MSTTEKPVAKPKVITLSEQTLAKIATQVSFEDDAAVGRFVADAINSYIHLGQLHRQGGVFFPRGRGAGRPRQAAFPLSTDITDGAWSAWRKNGKKNRQLPQDVNSTCTLSRKIRGRGITNMAPMGHHHR